jgi:hypothetical protein
MYKIAISGKAKSGKNTVANIIINSLETYNNRSLSSECIAFADPIKKMIKIMFPNLPDSYLWGESDLRSSIIPNAKNHLGEALTVRQVLLDLGKKGRIYSDSIWIDKVDIAVNDLSNKTDIVIIPDARFADEIEYLKKNNYFIIKLIRTEAAKINDISETGQDSIDISNFNHVLYNTDPIEKLKENIGNIIVPMIIKLNL